MRFPCAFCFLTGVLLVLLVAVHRSSAKIEPVNFEQTSILAPCLLTLSESYFKSKRAMQGSLVVVNLAPNKISRLERRILGAFNEDENHVLGVMVKDARYKHGNASRVTDRAQNYMLLMDNFDGLELALKMWKMLPTWNPLATTIIVIMTPFDTIDEKNKTVSGVFGELRKNGIIYANALYQMVDEPLKLIAETWFPYLGDNCAQSTDVTYKIDECEIHFNEIDSTSQHKVTKFNQEMFPKLPSTLHGCPMRVSCFIWAPFVVGTKSGLEIQMLQTITKQMGMNLEFRILHNELRGKRVTSDNKTWLIYADLTEKKSDVLVGGLYENPVSRKIVSSSIPYYQDDITWCVTKAGLAPTWLNVFIIFNFSTWIGLTLTLLIASIFFYYFVRIEGNYRENYVWSFLIMFGVGTAQYAHYWPVKGAIKIFLASLFFFGIHISTAYHSYLINVLTNPRRDEQISTVEKGIKAGLTFEIEDNTVEFFMKEDWISQHLLSHHKICHNMDDCFQAITKDRTKALAISRAHALNNPFGYSDNENFFCFPVSDDVVIYSAVMMFQRFHHLLPTINEKIRAIAESGLLTKWQKDSQRVSSKPLNSQESGGGHGGGKQMKLRYEHVEGAFLLILIGLGVSFVVFLLELLTQWLSRTQKNVRFLKTMESFLCHA